MSTIMIIDDDPEHAEMLTFCLTNSGHSVVWAGEWREAQKKLADVKPDLFILDYNMPGFTGKQIYDMLQGSDRTRAKPTIFLTAAYRIPENISLGAKTKFMRKPVDLKYLQVHVKAMLPPDAAGPPSTP